MSEYEHRDQQREGKGEAARFDKKCYEKCLDENVRTGDARIEGWNEASITVAACYVPQLCEREAILYLDEDDAA